MNTNILTNPGPDCITEDDLDFGRENFSDNTLPDFNFPHKKWGYMVTKENSFSFTCPDRAYPDINCIQGYLDMVHMIRNTGLSNYRLARVPISSDLRIDAWERHLQGYPDTRLIHYLKFGFPISLKSHCNLSTSEVKTFFSCL